MAGDENLRCRKRKDAAGENSEANIDGEASNSLSVTTSIPVILDGDKAEEEELIGIEEEMVAEVMQWLEREITSPSPKPPAINGNQESCGPSISDSASTVMANVDTSAGGGGVSFFFGTPAVPEFVAARMRAWSGGSVGNLAADGGGGGGAAEEEWFVRVLSEAGVEQ